MLEWAKKGAAMAKEWEKSFQAFLKYAGEELRRAGNELKQEAQELLENQEKLKKSLRTLSDWAKATAREVAEAAQKHAQGVEDKWSQKVAEGFYGFGKKETSRQTWGEPVEKMHTEPPPKAPQAAAPKVKSKAKKTSAPKMAGKAKKVSRPKAAPSKKVSRPRKGG